MAKVTLNHGSVSTATPQRAAEHLAELTGGVARPFHPCDGGWVCLLSGKDEDWGGALLEFYPADVVLDRTDRGATFRKGKTSARGSGTHFNITVPRSRATLEETCKKLGLPCWWRDWQGLLEVWLADDLLIECVPDR